MKLPPTAERLTKFARSQHGRSTYIFNYIIHEFKSSIYLSRPSGKAAGRDPLFLSRKTTNSHHSGFMAAT